VQALYAQRRYQDAARVAEKLVKENRDDAEAWIALASVHLAPEWALHGNDSRAEVRGGAGVKLTGRRPLVLVLLATAKHHRRSTTSACRCSPSWSSAAPPKVDGDALADMLVMRADIELRRETDDAEARKRAVADLDRAIATMPKATAARAMRADLRIHDGQLAEALADLEGRGRGRRPAASRCTTSCRPASARMGRKEEARRHYEIWRRLNRLTDSQGATNAPSPEERAGSSCAS
jgi:tetratricopeptide (TPR) repeat protein